MINDELGRHLVATRSIPEGTIILTERPLVVGPAQVTPPVCLGCYKLLQANSKKDCSKCGWPICSKVCEKSDAHVAECEVTARRGNGKVQYFQLSNSSMNILKQSLELKWCNIFIFMFNMFNLCRLKFELLSRAFPIQATSA